MNKMNKCERNVRLYISTLRYRFANSNLKCTYGVNTHHIKFLDNIHRAFQFLGNHSSFHMSLTTATPLSHCSSTYLNRFFFFALLSNTKQMNEIVTYQNLMFCYYPRTILPLNLQTSLSSFVVVSGDLQ